MNYKLGTHACCGGVAATVAAVANAMNFGPWSRRRTFETVGGDDNLNTAALEGCPSISRDGLRLFFASNRAGGYGGLDIYISARASVEDPWGAPVNAGAPINTSGDEFCPTPRRDGHGLLFVSDEGWLWRLRTSARPAGTRFTDGRSR